MKIINVVGARPNFMKIAPLMQEYKKHPEIMAVLVHTGQHYDMNMSESFFRDLEIPEPDYNLGVGSGQHGEQTGKIMIEFEKVCLKEKPDLVLVVGDVNSTIACALVAAKLHIKVAHVEAGLRSGNWKMPEEVNRVVTDRLSDYLFTTSEDAGKNLIKEGIDPEKIHFVGNVMIDTLMIGLEKKSMILKKLKIRPRDYAVLTLHRPETVDDREKLSDVVDALGVLKDRIRIFYAMHPRTKKMLAKFGLLSRIESTVVLLEPMPYVDFIHIVKNAKLVLTDSGGLQEETTILGVPCLTLRNETERPITITEGTNRIVGTSKEKIVAESMRLLSEDTREHSRPELWDGMAAGRIVEIIYNDRKTT
ncbi:MAG: UDP-N-acetylglucosamine 2-epimerase (non-hydrolyzing) [archaeon]